MIRAFDMSEYQRVIATEGRVRGTFVVHSSDNHGIFKIDPLEVILYSEEGNWGRVCYYRDFNVKIKDGVARVGNDLNSKKEADVEEFRDLIDATLAYVVQAYLAGPKSKISDEATVDIPKGTDA